MSWRVTDLQSAVREVVHACVSNVVQLRYMSAADVEVTSLVHYSVVFLCMRYTVPNM